MTSIEETVLDPSNLFSPSSTSEFHNKLTSKVKDVDNQLLTLESIVQSLNTSISDALGRHNNQISIIQSAQATLQRQFTDFANSIQVQLADVHHSIRAGSVTPQQPLPPLSPSLLSGTPLPASRPPSVVHLRNFSPLPSDAGLHVHDLLSHASRSTSPLSVRSSPSRGTATTYDEDRFFCSGSS